MRPRTEVEGKLAEIWKELLKTKEVGVEQNFFELGGHSLLVLQVMARIRRMFEVELAVRTMFEEPTIAGLAKEIEKAQALGLKAKMPMLETTTASGSGGQPGGAAGATGHALRRRRAISAQTRPRCQADHRKCQ